MAEGANDFGRYLQTCRKAKDISLSDVAQRTRITMACLQQIENEDLQQLPDPVFVKGFLRAYAEVVGADAQEAIARYETSRAKRMQTGRTQFQKRRGGSFWFRIFLAAALLSGVIAGTLYLYVRMQIPTAEAPQAQPVAKPAPEAAKVPLQAPEKKAAPAPALPASVDQSAPALPASVDQSAPASPEMSVQDHNATNETTAPAVSPNVKTELKLEIEAVEVTWLKVIADGQAPKEFSMQPGEQIILSAKSHFNLLIGNAGGVHLTLDGRSVYVPGKSGQVVTLQLP